MSPLLYQSICLHHRAPPCCLRILPAGKLRVYHIVPLCARRVQHRASLQQHAICISCVICSLLNLCSDFSLMRMYPVLVFSVSFCAPGFAHGFAARVSVDDVDENKNQLSDQRNLKSEIQIGSR